MTSRSTSNVAGHTVGNQTEIHRAAADIHVKPGTAAAGSAGVPDRVGKTAGTLGLGAHIQTDRYRREEHRGVRHTEGLGLEEDLEAPRIAGLGSVGEGQEEHHIDLGQVGVLEAHRTETDLLGEGTLHHHRRTG